jgi:hypothetical protein
MATATPGSLTGVAWCRREPKKLHWRHWATPGGPRGVAASDSEKRSFSKSYYASDPVDTVDTEEIANGDRGGFRASSVLEGRDGGTRVVTGDGRQGGGAEPAPP